VANDLNMCVIYAVFMYRFIRNSVSHFLCLYREVCAVVLVSCDVSFSKMSLSLGRPTLVMKALSFTHALFSLSFFFCHSTMLSSHAQDGHKMYFRGSVIGKALTFGIGILPTPPIIFEVGVKKCEIWRRLNYHSTLSCTRLKMQQDIQNLKQKCNAAMIALCPGQVW